MNLLTILLLAAVLRIGAGDATIKTTGGHDATKDGWNLWTEGEWGDVVRITAAGTYHITVRAAGSPLQSEWPLMALKVDDHAELPLTVGQTEFADYTFEIKLTAGSHRIVVAFLNDACEPSKEDRNLYLAGMEIRPPPGAAVPVRSTGDEQALAAAPAGIERNRKGNAAIQVVDAAGRPVAGARVTVELVRHEFLFGCNIYMFDRFGSPQEDALYKARFAELFNYATVGFYWRHYEPERGQPDYPYTDMVVAWCRDHQIRLKGHPLLWNCEHGVPRWADRQPSPELQKQRVTDIIHRYGREITYWEVVNEPAHLPGLAIDEPYRWAHAADPKTYLIVNDYQVLANGFPPLFTLLETAKANGVPFDGIGIQAHEPRTMRFSLDRVTAILDHYATLGKDLHITEFTPTSAGEPITDSPVSGKWDEQAQAEYAERFYRVCFAHPAVVAITWWDLCDTGAWLPGGGMLRRDLSPKPVYKALRKLIHEEWHTKTTGTANKKGEFKFRGFYGYYTVTIRTGDRQKTVEIQLSHNSPRIVIHL